MAGGWPIASYVFKGRLADRSTVEVVLAEVRARFALHRVVWVADRGMVSTDTLARSPGAQTATWWGSSAGGIRQPRPSSRRRGAPGRRCPKGEEVQEVHLPGDATG